MEVFVLLFGAFIYFLPALNALSKSHASTFGIFLLNLFLGWTLVGWVVALIWSVDNNRSGERKPSPKTHIRCPDCQELILKEARVCKHCGCRLTPSH